MPVRENQRPLLRAVQFDYEKAAKQRPFGSPPR
jgi:hypothetical protein